MIMTDDLYLSLYFPAVAGDATQATSNHDGGQQWHKTAGTASSMLPNPFQDSCS
jgi:hypothetical protein